ncbi:MAG: ribbon-helix-helix protein, CopG family [Gammaproteobacteria bacterium]
MKTLTVKIPEQLDRRLTAAAKAQNRTKSELIRGALGSYLRQPQVAARGSALDLAADLIGSFEGPGDLSASRRYMDDYGT